MSTLALLGDSDAASVAAASARGPNIYQCECCTREEGEEIIPDKKPCTIALDGEMVGVGVDGIESRLARLSIVDCQQNIRLDVYVQVDEEVTDYRTHVSGIASHHLLVSNGAIPLSDVVDRIVTSGWFDGSIKVVGHSLENDFKCIGIEPPEHAVRDTTRCLFLCRDPRRPLSLRQLALDRLNFRMQQDGQAHDSVTDANVAMQLYLSVRERWESYITASSPARDVDHLAAAAAADDLTEADVLNEDEEEKKAIEVQTPFEKCVEMPSIRQVTLSYRISDIFAPPDLSSLPQVPERFDSAAHYANIFRPLVREENRCASRRALELLSDVEEGADDGMIEVELSKAPKRRGIEEDENDIEGELEFRLVVKDKHKYRFAERTLLPSSYMLLMAHDDAHHFSSALGEGIASCIESSNAAGAGGAGVGAGTAVHDWSKFPLHLFGLIKSALPDKRKLDAKAPEYLFRLSRESATEFLCNYPIKTTRFQVVPINSLISDERADSALRSLSSGLNRPDFFHRVLRGQDELPVGTQPNDDPHSHESDGAVRAFCDAFHLNASQKDAIVAASQLKVEDGIGLVQGPPGTGQHTNRQMTPMTHTRKRRPADEQ